MKKIYLISTCLLILGMVKSINAQIQQSDWQNNELNRELADEEKNTQLKESYNNYRYAEISIDNFKERMTDTSQEISIPSPNGTYEIFEINPVQVVADEVKHLYTIKTFRGIKKGDPTTMIACDISDGGFHASVFGSESTYYIQPIEHAAPEQVVIYFNKDRRVSKHICQVIGSQNDNIDVAVAQLRTPNQKSTFRLAVAGTGEYSQAFGGSPYSTTNVLNALASGVNMINLIFLRDLGVEYTLVTNAALIFSDPATDPYNLADDMIDNLGINNNQCEDALGFGGFDIGHVVSVTGTGGLAAFAAVCDEFSKGEGLSDASTNLTELWIDYVSHEIGHQMGADHNFSANECGEGVAMNHYEPGEGSTLMCYVGLCGIGYTVATDPFFHYNSIEKMQTTISNTSCATTSSAGNSSSPVADAKSDMTIPKQTPFLLVGSATDGNDPAENLTYSWQQWEGNGEETDGSPNCNSLNQPLFQYRVPTTQNYRALPQYSDVLAGNNDQQWEKLPCVAGGITFSLAIRDNNSSFGRMGQDLTEVTVANTGPFEVSAPNGGESFNGGENETITWTVNGTDAHCATVDILLSTDGGSTYAVIADAVNNDGSESVMIPNTASTTARIIVRCNVAGGYRAASTFYDVSNSNFTVVEGSVDTYQIEDFNISIYPNPTSDRVFIDLQKTENFTFRLTDLNGRIIQEGEFNHSTSLNTEHLMSGLYYLQLKHKTSGKSVIEKLVVQK